jgi:alpha-beta hydrolase superfamily lysophospholipase
VRSATWRCLAPVVAVLFGTAALGPVANAEQQDPAGGSAVTPGGQPASGSQQLKKTKKPKPVKKIMLKASSKRIVRGGTVKLTGKVKPKQQVYVAFEERLPIKGSKEFRGVGAKHTNKKGKVSLKVAVRNAGTYDFRLVSKKKRSKVVEVTGTKPAPPVPPKPKPGPEPGPDPGPDPGPKPDPYQPKRVVADWPADDNLEVDQQYNVDVEVLPLSITSVQTRLQFNDGSGWSDLYGGTMNTRNGKARLTLSVPDVGSAQLRVKVSGFGVKTDAVTRDFADDGDALYNIPLKLPDQRGAMVKAQEVQLNYPKLPVPNPLKLTENIMLPQIGSPAAGPPACTTDPQQASVPCPIPGKQYRIMYTTERWYPDNTGNGAVQGGSRGATGLLLVPENVQPNAPVVAWAHPTLGQENKCSISRGTDPIPIPVNKGTKTEPGPGGMNLNLADIIFFLDQMLAKGYIVVMPDYLGIAVNGPTSNQKTYIVGPQEARDVFFAVDALHTGAKPKVGWPGLPEAGNRFVVAGHSQGGHAALWSGILQDDLEKRTGQKLLGTVAAAPATDINKMVGFLWDNQLNWVLGPEVIQTWATYLGSWAFQNNVLTTNGYFGMATYPKYCTTQAWGASDALFPNGYDKPGVSFMKDPEDPANQQAFYNWGKIFGKMTPDIRQGRSNSYPKDLPTLLISGTADEVTLSQVNAAFQETFCEAGADLQAYWTPVLSGGADPSQGKNINSARNQAADHINPLAFPWTTGWDGTKSGAPGITGAGTLLQFVADRFANRPSNPNCGDVQQIHKDSTPASATPKVDSWYVFPRVLSKPTEAGFWQTAGSSALPLPIVGGATGTEKNPAPAKGTINAKTYTQTGCGFPFKLSGVSYVSNSACSQWGLYPYGEFLYDDAAADSTWGNYPYEVPKPRGSLASAGPGKPIPTKPGKG